MAGTTTATTTCTTTITTTTTTTTIATTITAETHTKSDHIIWCTGIPRRMTHFYDGRIF